MVNNYDRSKLYKIVCNVTGKIYVGSTTEPSLASRLTGHKSHYKYYLTGKRDYITSFEILKNGNYYIELICNAACTSKDELNAIEGYHIRNLDCVNRCVPGRTQKQYNDDHAVEIKKYKKNYSEVHAVKIKQYINQYTKDNADKLKQKINCECGGKHTYANISTHLKSIKHQNYLKIEL